MKYEYMVRHDGILYMPGEDVPDGASSFSENEPLPFTDYPQKTYTKTEINRMSAEDLRKFATETGVDGADGISGTDLKKILIDKLGL